MRWGCGYREGTRGGAQRGGNTPATLVHTAHDLGAGSLRGQSQLCSTHPTSVCDPICAQQDSTQVQQKSKSRELQLARSFPAADLPPWPPSHSAPPQTHPRSPPTHQQIPIPPQTTKPPRAWISACRSAASAECGCAAHVSLSLPTNSGMSCTTMGTTSLAEDRTTSLIASKAWVCSRVCSARSSGREACKGWGGGEKGEKGWGFGAIEAAATTQRQRIYPEAAACTHRLQQRLHHVLKVG